MHPGADSHDKQNWGRNPKKSWVAPKVTLFYLGGGGGGGDSPGYDAASHTNLNSSGGNEIDAPL